MEGINPKDPRAHPANLELFLSPACAKELAKILQVSPSRISKSYDYEFCGNNGDKEENVAVQLLDIGRSFDGT